MYENWSRRRIGSGQASTEGRVAGVGTVLRRAEVVAGAAAAAEHEGEAARGHLAVVPAAGGRRAALLTTAYRLQTRWLCPTTTTVRRKR